MTALALLVVVLAVFSGTGGVRAGAQGAADSGPPRVVVVAEGDTLWDLAAPNVPDGRDRAAYVAEVVAENRLDPLRLVPGTPVRLP